MSYKTELQITILIEVPVYSIHVFHYSCQRTSKLSVSNPLWQSVFPRGKSQGLESTHSVNYRTTESRISTFGRNEAFHKYIEALHTLDGQIYRNRSRETVLFAKDEFPRASTSAEALAKLKPAFKKDGGRVTAGNASGINDGAAAMVLASGEAVEKYGLKPMARLISWGHGGVDPRIMGLGPVPACRQALEKSGLSIDDVDLIEANEAFAAQSIAVARELGFDMSRVNVNGGAISIGHPVGASGARIIVTLLHEMLKRPEAKRGLATLCIGGGMGVATLFEKCGR